MAAVPYATVDDLREHWSELPAEKEADAIQKLKEASIEVRALFPDVDGRILAGTLDAEVPQLVVCRMVKRALDVADDADVPTTGMDSVQFGAGPFTFGGKVHNPDGNVYLSAADKRLLRVVRDERPFSTQPGRPSWAS